MVKALGEYLTAEEDEIRTKGIFETERYTYYVQLLS